MADPFIKAPGDRVTLVCDFTDELASAEQIASMDAFTVTPAGVTIHGTPAADSTGKKIEGEISVGVDGVTYTVAVTVTTDTGSPLAHILKRTWKLHVRDL